MPNTDELNKNMAALAGLSVQHVTQSLNSAISHACRLAADDILALPNRYRNRLTCIAAHRTRTSQIYTLECGRQARQALHILQRKSASLL